MSLAQINIRDVTRGRGSHLPFPSNCSSSVSPQILAAPMNTGRWRGQRQPATTSRPDPVLYGAALLLAARRTRIPCSAPPAPITGDLPLASTQQRPHPPPAPCSAPDLVAILATPQALHGHNCSSGGAGLIWRGAAEDLAVREGRSAGSRPVSLRHWGTGHPRRLVV
jgi:hypothetical protein